ncbi:MAG TPA: serine hydrolase, partial [Bryobacteraceae bacterium]
ALWDISLINGTLLQPASLRALTTEVDLKNGAHTGYALGLSVSNTNGHRKWAHGGGTAGFTSSNVTLPDDRMAIVVLTNSELGAAARIERQVERLLTAPAEDPAATASLDRARQVFRGLAEGKVDRGWFTDDANAYFTAQTIADFAASLKPYAAPTSFTQTSKGERGGMTHRSFTVRAGEKSVNVSTFFTPGGKIAQYLVTPGL